MSGWMVGEWGGDGSELASALLNLHQDRWPLGQLVLWTAVCGLRVVKHCPDIILYCRTVTGVGSDGFAIITSQQFYRLVCEPPLSPHPYTLSLLFTNVSFAFSLRAVPILFCTCPIYSCLLTRLDPP